MQDENALIGLVYDCAANPELWSDTLSAIRDRMGAAFVSVGFADMSPLGFGRSPYWVKRNSPWDEGWLDRLAPLLHMIPHGEQIIANGIDAGWSQMTCMDEAEFRGSAFCREWVEPQGLRDCLSVNYLQRDSLNGILTAPSALGRALYDEADKDIFARLAPHIRRAILINDMVDKGKLALALYRQVLDTLATPVFIIGSGQRIVFSNAQGEDLLSAGNLLFSNNGNLAVRRVAGIPTALDEAIDRAARGDVAIGLSGIGVPLIGKDGERAAAYVLPISGSDIRGDMGRGHCAVFIARRGEQQPMLQEVLRTLFDLTQSEARIAGMIAQGEGPAAIGEALGLSVNTVRSHLARCYTKTQSTDQTALGSLVNALLPPAK